MIFLYSLIFPSLWFAIGMFMSYVLPSVRLGAVGLVAIIYGTVSTISWLFAKKKKRLFSKFETIRLIVYCSFWAAICESLALFYIYTSDESGSRPDEQAMLMIIGGTILFDILLLSLAFAFLPKRLIPKYLEKNKKPESGSAYNSDQSLRD